MTRMVRQRKAPAARRAYTDEFKEEAVQMLLDGHRPKAVAANLGLSGTNLLYRWKAKLLEHSGPAAATLEGRVRELEEQLRTVERERDVLKKALAIFSQKI